MPIRSSCRAPVMIGYRTLVLIGGLLVVFFLYHVQISDRFKPTTATSKVSSANAENETISLHEFYPEDQQQLTNLTPPEISKQISEIQLGWDIAVPQWLEDMCPQVVDHFTRFLAFSHNNPHDATTPLQTTSYAAISVCTMHVAHQFATSIGAKLYLHAGSHLGAVVHGQPIPWDDDADALVHFRHKNDIIRKLCDEGGHQVHPNVTLKCDVGLKAVKVYLDDGHRPLIAGYNYAAPFVDLFFYQNDNETMWETKPDGKWSINRLTKTVERYHIADYFPTRPYYFGGIYVLGPHPRIVQNRYKLNICVVGAWNHRLELATERGGYKLDCSDFKGNVPFVVWNANGTIMKDEIATNHDSQQLFPTRGTTVNPLVVTSVEQRAEWAKAPPSEGQRLTNKISNLDTIEIDNTISPHETCNSNTMGPLKVLEYNAERGRWWLEAVSLLKDADVIILNEMDIGMARSGQQHTTRLLAHFLGMNYAWGLEFVELTEGDKEDRQFTHKMPNFHGLHGNAFLTRCAISDPVLFRNDVGQYFSDKKMGLNANGLEKRLGGRMGMFGRIIVNGSPVVIGSVHKINGYRSEIKQYIGSSQAIIAGDQGATFCTEVGLKNIVSSEQHFTWPASCSSFGSGRGDNICSNMNVVDPEVVTKPCVQEFNLSISLGDHALTGASFEVKLSPFVR